MHRCHATRLETTAIRLQLPKLRPDAIQTSDIPQSRSNLLPTTSIEPHSPRIL
ncbi:uncharacterized protein MYCGRDRAFT_106587 [Zymoseptoria tritici IPO323]|uniref:Uncharacterized protein n=1 Tax=Zymoseptoria tritici (strain CBS 115943 / IPO323) TaxID=336722 RepID=F9XQL4_ZYMTI|nr:uncharacterized protein MYCGRDRAFT_106587 [Zymoseptoria tritici IPO323]EGP82469.1 hypothetical protein MYCGRDRAFT_106587 [Zymoseptoria tritici IPO323]